MEMLNNCFVTTCPACGKKLPVGSTTPPPRCVRCQTPYCDAACRNAHWSEHKSECKRIARLGGAEPAFARAMSLEAAERATDWASRQDDYEGAKCYICLAGDEEEGLVRGCGCGRYPGYGFAHVSCLARHARMTVKCDDLSPIDARVRWFRCQLCDGRFDHYKWTGDVDLALAWEHWRTHANGPLTDPHRGWAAVSLALRLEMDYRDAAMSVLYDVVHNGTATHMRYPHVDVIVGALFFVYWYRVLCRCLGIRDCLVVDDDNDDPFYLDRRKYTRGLADDYLSQIGDPNGQAVQTAVQMMTLVCGNEESNLKDLDPEEVVDRLVQQINKAKARRDAGDESLPDGFDVAAIPAPGT